VITVIPKKSTPTIKESPITVQLCPLLCNNNPVPFYFTSFSAIKEALQPNSSLVDPLSNKPIKIDQVERINPDTVYDLVGVGFTYWPLEGTGGG
jgi:hypothetical protein